MHDKTYKRRQQIFREKCKLFNANRFLPEHNAILETFHEKQKCAACDQVITEDMTGHLRKCLYKCVSDKGGGGGGGCGGGSGGSKVGGRGSSGGSSGGSSVPSSEGTNGSNGDGSDNGRSDGEAGNEASGEAGGEAGEAGEAGGEAELSSESSSNSQSESIADKYTVSRKDLFQGSGEVITFKSKKINDDIEGVLNELTGPIQNELKKKLNESPNLKFYVEARNLHRRERAVYEDEDDVIFYDKTRVLNSKSRIVNKQTDLEDTLGDVNTILQEKSSKFTQDGSDFILKDVLSVKLFCFKVNPLRMAGWSANIPLNLEKRFRKLKNAYLISFPNSDSECINWNLACYQTELEKSGGDYKLLTENLKKISKKIGHKSGMAD